MDSLNLQSHHTGIEIYLQVNRAKSDLTFNRTIPELKYDSTCLNANGLISFNRTIPELKYAISKSQILALESFNRTIPELK